MTKPHWRGGSGGKGSAARNMEITAEEFASNWDRIFGKKKEKQNEQRTGRNDGEMESGNQGSGEAYQGHTASGGSVSEEDSYANDRLPPDSNH